MNTTSSSSNRLNIAASINLFKCRGAMPVTNGCRQWPSPAQERLHFCLQQFSYLSTGDNSQGALCGAPCVVIIFQRAQWVRAMVGTGCVATAEDLWSYVSCSLTRCHSMRARTDWLFTSCQIFNQFCSGATFLPGKIEPAMAK